MWNLQDIEIAVTRMLRRIFKGAKTKMVLYSLYFQCKFVLHVRFNSCPATLGDQYFKGKVSQTPCLCGCVYSNICRPSFDTTLWHLSMSTHNLFCYHKLFHPCQHNSLRIGQCRSIGTKNDIALLNIMELFSILL